jgi:hypothetical protein
MTTVEAGITDAAFIRRGSVFSVRLPRGPRPQTAHA